MLGKHYCSWHILEAFQDGFHAEGCTRVPCYKRYDWLWISPPTLSMARGAPCNSNCWCSRVVPHCKSSIIGSGVQIAGEGYILAMHVRWVRW